MTIIIIIIILIIIIIKSIAVNTVKLIQFYVHRLHVSTRKPSRLQNCVSNITQRNFQEKCDVSEE
jgi:uncharacterized protein YxeA